MMFQLYYTALEAGLAALVLIPILLILNKIRFHNLKTTVFYFLFAVYLTGVYAVVGLPNITYIRFELNLNLIPFADMLSDLSGTLLNVVLFVPLGLSLPVLWPKFQNLWKTVLFGFCFSLVIELLQVFTFRATDINDLITNTLGTFAGYWAGLMIGRLFPRLKCSGRESDLPLLAGCSAAVMFFLQPLIWKLIY